MNWKRAALGLFAGAVLVWTVLLEWTFVYQFGVVNGTVFFVVFHLLLLFAVSVVVAPLLHIVGAVLGIAFRARAMAEIGDAIGN